METFCIPDLHMSVINKRGDRFLSEKDLTTWLLSVGNAATKNGLPIEISQIFAGVVGTILDAK